MATLVLSTVGTILGGPIGGAIGGLLGQSIDQQLFGPGPRQGPRLGDLAVQTSSYGTPIPRIFGTMRTAGSIVWSTDLQEDSQTEGAKGQPEAITYSYSASFAVALSSRRIGSIGRIWADGKLIRTAEGEFTVGTGFRFYGGSEDQPVDPLIGSIEGPDLAPAYRGIALAVFEHLQLAEFGNRIPFLTFEVEADPNPIPLGLVLSEVSGGAIASSDSRPLPGYAAYGASIASAVQPLVETFGIPLADTGLAIASPTAEILQVDASEVGCSAGPDLRPKYERSQVPARNLPSALSLSYYDPDREYQTGLARASIDNEVAANERLELPAALHAPAAKALAETSLGRRWAERDRLTLRLPPTYLAILPGTLLLAPESGQPWKAERVTLESMAVVAELRPTYATIGPVPADPGRVLPSLGVAPARTAMTVMELPDDGSGSAQSPVIAVAATMSGGSWRALPVQVEVGGAAFGTRRLAGRAILGAAETALAPGQSAILDLLNSVDVQLSDTKQWLESRDDRVLADGVNLALLGDELIQFGQAIPLGSGRFRLSRLLRGRRGSDWAMHLHAAGEQFVVLEPAKLLRLDLSSGQIGAVVRATPMGISDSPADAIERVVTGEAMRLLSPAHLRASIYPDGTLRCSWVRRSRRGWAWLDGVDAPLDCAEERYRVKLQSGAGSIELETDEPGTEFSAAEIAAFQGQQVELSVVQVGDLAVSRPAFLTLNLS